MEKAYTSLVVERQSRPLTPDYLPLHMLALHYPKFSTEAPESHVGGMDCPEPLLHPVAPLCCVCPILSLCLCLSLFQLSKNSSLFFFFNFRPETKGLVLGLPGWLSWLGIRLLISAQVMIRVRDPAQGMEPA